MICVIHGYFEGYCEICHVEHEHDENDLVTVEADEDE